MTAQSAVHSTDLEGETCDMFYFLLSKGHLVPQAFKDMCVISGGQLSWL